jgi:hypothetical protein
MKIVEKIIDGCNEVKKNPEIHKDAKTLASLVIKDCNDALDAIQKLFDSAALNSVPNGWVKKKEWVGLTDKEIEEGQKQSWVDRQAFESAVWWAEAKLKEKNT